MQFPVWQLLAELRVTPPDPCGPQAAGAASGEPSELPAPGFDPHRAPVAHDEPAVLPLQLPTLTVHLLPYLNPIPCHFRDTQLWTAHVLQRRGRFEGQGA